MDCLKHHEARLAFRSFLLPDEALLQERLDPLQRVQSAFGVADLLHGLQGAASREHRHPSEEGLLILLQKVVAPVYGTPQGLLAGGQVARSPLQELHSVAEALEHLLGWEQPYPRRRKLYGKRKPV